MEGSASAAAVLHVSELPLQELHNTSLHGPAGTSLYIRQQHRTTAGTPQLAMVIRQEQVIYPSSFLPPQSEAGKVKTGKVLSNVSQPVLWPGTMDTCPRKERGL